MNILTSNLPTPPQHLRERVHGTGDATSFWAVGECAATDIMRALGSAAHFRVVLDFGCGCGRVLPFMCVALPSAQFHAADIDAEAIAWVRGAYPAVRACVTNDLPPLPYSDATFDLIYAVSVWTHLDEVRQGIWLAEVRRVLRPGGILVASLHGERAAKRTLNQEGRDYVAQRGFAYSPVDIWRDVFPSWYGLAWHTPDYVVRVWSEYLAVRTYLPSALNDNHDLVVCEKP